MKRKDISALHHKEVGELQKMLKEARENLFTMKMDHSQFKLKNTRSIFMKRKEIAALLTVLKGKEMPA